MSRRVSNFIFGNESGHAASMTDTAGGPWARKKPLPPPLSPETRPPENLLLALRARVERGSPFDLARRACGVGDEVHEAWMTRGKTIHTSQPDRLYHAGGCVLAGSLEPEAEYARIATTLQAGAAADLVGQVWEIANDPSRRRDQLEAIRMILRGMGETAFDPRAVSDVTVSAQVETGGAGVDQSVLDAMTDAERAEIRESRRLISEQRARLEAAVRTAGERAVAAPVAEPAIAD